MVCSKMNGFETFLEIFTCPSAHRVSKMCATECANTKYWILRRFSALNTYLPGTCGWPKCVAVYTNVRLAHVFVRLMFWSWQFHAVLHRVFKVLDRWFSWKPRVSPQCSYSENTCLAKLYHTTSGWTAGLLQASHASNMWSESTPLQDTQKSWSSNRR